jgi:ribosomal protein L4
VDKDTVDKKYIFFSGKTKGLVVSLFHDVQGLNVYSILQHDTLVMSIGAIRRIEDRLHTPINR